jgi:hypothetical protein
MAPGPPFEVVIGWEAVYYSRVYAGLISTLFIFSTLLVVARLYTRARSANKLKLDDWIIAVASVRHVAWY